MWAFRVDRLPQGGAQVAACQCGPVGVEEREFFVFWVTGGPLPLQRNQAGTCGTADPYLWLEDMVRGGRPFGVGRGVVDEEQRYLPRPGSVRSASDNHPDRRIRGVGQGLLFRRAVHLTPHGAVGLAAPVAVGSLAVSGPRAADVKEGPGGGFEGERDAHRGGSCPRVNG